MSPALLSSNWKKLQSKLQKDAPPAKANDSPSTKRKRDTNDADTDNNQQKTNTSKRFRMEPKAITDSDFAKLRRAKSAASLDPNSNPPSSRQRANTTSTPTTLPTPAAAESPKSLTNQGLSPTNLPGRYIALDCEMVGVGPTPEKTSQLARVSVVNYHGQQIYDSFVLPIEKVTDYRTQFSGIRPHNLKPGTARSFTQIQTDISALLTGRVLIGHALKNDTAVLMLSHPQRDMRDTARYAKFRQLSAGKAPSLRKLAREKLGLDIQSGEHSSVEDARACMALFRLEKDGFEAENERLFGRVGKEGGKSKSSSSGAMRKKKRH